MQADNMHMHIHVQKINVKIKLVKELSSSRDSWKLDLGILVGEPHHLSRWIYIENRKKANRNYYKDT